MENPIPAAIPASDGIPRLDLDVLPERHMEGRRRVLARLDPKIKRFWESARWHSVPEPAAGLVRCKYADRPALEEREYIVTRDVLINALHDLAAAGQLADPTWVVVQKLRQKFEVFGRIAARYHPQMRKCGDEWAEQETCGLLAFVLLCRFAEKHDYRDLNAAIKINDGLDGADAEAGEITYAALMKEIEMVEGAMGIS